jgi:hypothetical protein
MEGTGVAGTVAWSEVKAARCVNGTFDSFDELEKRDVVEADHEGVSASWARGRHDPTRSSQGSHYMRQIVGRDVEAR